MPYTSICFLLILLIFGCKKTSQEFYESEIIQEAALSFRKTLYLKNVPESDRQLMIDALTRQENWIIIADSVNISKTHHHMFPLTGNQVTLFAPSRTNREEYILIERLFLYDLGRDVWLPISFSRNTFKNHQISETDESDLWDSTNDWHEIWKK